MINHKYSFQVGVRRGGSREQRARRLERGKSWVRSVGFVLGGEYTNIYKVGTRCSLWPT